jgi:RND family efflux transporter MFP subunit
LSKKRIYIIIAVVLVIFLVLFYFRLRNDLAATKRQPVIMQTVVLSSPVRGNVLKKLSFTGDILPIQQANIYSRVSGNLERIYVDLGDHVYAGKLLALIDKTMFEQNVRQTEGLYKQALATMENNQVNYDRNQGLFEKGLLSQGDLDNARTTYDVSVAQVETALANFKNARTQFDYCNIRAPFSGYITKRVLDPGTYITTGVASANNTIFVMSNIDILKIMVNVLENDIPLLDNVISSAVSVDAYPSELFTAHVNKASQSIDLNTRTMPTEIDIYNKKEMLKPGMFAKIDLILQKDTNVLTLPKQCVLKDDKGNFVYEVNKDSVTQKKYVKVGIIEENTYEITDGLSDSEKVVTLGMELINDGSKVRLAK